MSLSFERSVGDALAERLLFALESGDRAGSDLHGLRNAIGLHSLDQDTCVVAGPGSGKTTVLIERFRGLVESGVSPLRILAITFTEKMVRK